MGRILRDVAHDFNRTLIQKITQLLDHSIPRASRIVSKKHTDNRKKNQNQRRQRENCVIGERRSKLRSFVVDPLLGGLFKQSKDFAEKILRTGFCSSHYQYFRFAKL